MFFQKPCLINISSLYQPDTIIALTTPPGQGAVAILRLSGVDAFQLIDKHFTSFAKKISLKDVASHSLHFGNIIDGDQIIDEVLVAIFKNPTSYTGEDVVEINCHGSLFIQRRLLNLFIKSGARQAEGGEFTLRAFLNGKLDLSQAEAVADLIESKSAAAHQVALQQMRGGYSKDLKDLRQKLLDFASLIELELDFSEEDVEFAERKQLTVLIAQLLQKIKQLIESFQLGNVYKNGIPVAIVGAPNVGKSTLLNALLNEEKAIVSAIAGTTRDAIEDEISIHGVAFRFIDTAGIRHTDDTIESIGIQRTYENMEKAQLILYILDANEIREKSGLKEQNKQEINRIKEAYPDKKQILLLNKTDLLAKEALQDLQQDFPEALVLSAKNKNGLDILTRVLADMTEIHQLNSAQSIVSNARHFEALNTTYEALAEVKQGLASGISGDLLSIDIRESLRQLGKITGDFEVDRDLLGNIFANFCVGK